MKRLSLLFATLLGAGYFPVAPATFGSALTLILWWYLQPLPIPVYLAVTLAIILAGFYFCGEAEKALGHDAHPIVLDEVAGQLIALALAPRTIPAMLTAFVLFRILDVWKPPPAYQALRLPGGVGGVMDDVCAGLYALGLMRLLGHFLGPKHYGF